MSDKPKRPSFQMYPSDWLRSTDLRTCSVGARGLWMDIICFMHEGNPYGHLRVKDKKVTPDILAQMTGIKLKEILKFLQELEDAGVFSRTEDGTIFSRRMIKDEKLRNLRAEAGKQGGNPTLKDNHLVKQNKRNNITKKDKQKQTPSSSSSSSSTNNNYLDFLTSFDSARKIYPGTKNGNVTEFENFKKKHADWEQVLPILKNSIESQILKREAKQKAGATFIPEWKHFQTWINKRCWEEEGQEQIKPIKDPNLLPTLTKEEVDNLWGRRTDEGI